MVINSPFNLLQIHGFCSTGMTLAKHLAICERKSAYPSEDKAKAATATHSMLDVLGLMRRPEEKAVDEKKEDEEKSKVDEDTVAVNEKESVVDVSSEEDKQEEPMDVDVNKTVDGEAAVVENSIENDASAVSEKPVTDNDVSDHVQTIES